MNTKVCSRGCGDLPITSFYRDKSKPDGYRPNCIECHKSDMASRKEQYHANRVESHARNGEHFRGIARAWYRKNRESIRERERERYRANPGPARKYAAQYRVANAERVKRTIADWRKRNPDKRAEHSRKRRAILADADGSFTTEEFIALLEACDGRCLACDSTEDICADHVIPLSKGGSNAISNIQPLCRSCNSRKKDKTIDYR